MSHYFIAGNMWLLGAAVVFWGRQSVASGDLSQWKLFDVGRRFDAFQYPWFLAAPIGMAAVCFLLHVRWSRSQA